MFVNFSMHRILLSILFTTSLFAKDIIAVLDLETIGLNSGEATILTQRLTTKLISIGQYEVVERANMDKILKEQKFQKSGCTDSECAVEIGQLLNTDFIVMGSVNKFGSTWTLDARLIDVGLGKGIISAEYTMKGEIDGLITTGITSIAKQLCGIQTTKQSSITEPTQTNVNGQSFVNKKQLSEPAKIILERKSSFYGLVIGFKVYDNNTYIGKLGSGKTLSWDNTSGNLNMHVSVPLTYGMGLWNYHPINTVVDANQTYYYKINSIGELIDSRIGSKNSQKDISAQDIKSVKQKNKNWYFTLVTLESRIPRTTSGETEELETSFLQTRYKNFQFIIQSGSLDGCTDERKELNLCNTASGIISSAIGYYRNFNISNINIFQKINVNNIGFNYWYHFQPSLSTFVENGWVTETSVPFHQLSLEIETTKYLSMGLNLELGVNFFIDGVPSELEMLEGFFLKAGVNMLSFGRNF